MGRKRSVPLLFVAGALVILISLIYSATTHTNKPAPEKSPMHQQNR